MTDSRDQLALPVANHEDDVGLDPFHDVVPADPVMTEDGEVVIFDARARLRGHVMESAFQPCTGQFARLHRGIEADDPDFVPLWEGNASCRRDGGLKCSRGVIGFLPRFAGFPEGCGGGCGGGFHQR